MLVKLRSRLIAAGAIGNAQRKKGINHDSRKTTAQLAHVPCHQASRHCIWPAPHGCVRLRPNRQKRDPREPAKYSATRRHSRNPPLAVLGIGGLGHLGIQFANKFGYKVAAIGRGAENAALAKKLGASVYINSTSTNAAEALQELGGARVILATAPSSKAMSELIDGRGPNGKLMVIGATFDPIDVTPIQLISGSRTIQGSWAAGTPAHSEDTLCFADLSGVRPMIETYPLEKAAEAYARMMSGKAQLRVVLTM
jgi:D-arabinose 1-dehydrogenase-like Zn-dependent alcohol dehydrogenase